MSFDYISSYAPTNEVMEDTNLSESSNSSLIETTTNINVELGVNLLGQDLELSVGDSYQSWDLAEAYLNNYAKTKGFSLRRKRVETNDNGEIRQ
ncbi:4643_t:CDS:2, partial [Cetraspora pellucida]